MKPVKRRILLVLTVCLAFCLLTGGIPTKRFGMGRPFNMAPFGMVDECDANWKPTKIDSLVLWVEGDFPLVTSLTSAALCSIWTDYSGKGNHLTVIAGSGTTRQPAIVTGALNGHTGLHFDGVNSYLYRTSATWADCDSGTIIIITSYTDSIAAAQYTVASASNVYYGVGTSIHRALNNGGTVISNTTHIPSGNPFRKVRLVYASSDTIFVAGVAIASGDAGTSAWGQFIVGSGTGGGQPSHITVCAIFFYKNKILASGSPELAKLNAYILKRYGL